ncbi:LOW QUALITY PROTEIN: uncharacterized protein Dwil_GK27276, partial [Drosophila willistoni]
MSTYVRPNKLQGNGITCRNFHSTLSNVIKSCFAGHVCNINLTFYCKAKGDEVSQKRGEGSDT